MPGSASAGKPGGQPAAGQCPQRRLASLTANGRRVGPHRLSDRVGWHREHIRRRGQETERDVLPAPATAASARQRPRRRARWPRRPRTRSSRARASRRDRPASRPARDLGHQVSSGADHDLAVRAARPRHARASPARATFPRWPGPPGARAAGSAAPRGRPSDGGAPAQQHGQRASLRSGAGRPRCSRAGSATPGAPRRCRRRPRRTAR